MVDVGVHKALLVSVLSHPQDFRGHGRDRWNSDVHVVPGWHGEQGWDLDIRITQVHGRGHTDVILRTDSRST